MPPTKHYAGKVVNELEVVEQTGLRTSRKDVVFLARCTVCGKLLLVTSRHLHRGRRVCRHSP